MSGGSHSPNLGLLDQEASMQNMDRLVEALEMEARELGMSKRRKLFSDEPFNSALQPTGSNTSTTSECIMDLSAACLRKLVDFPIKRECRRIVPPFEVEAEFLKLTGRKYKKDAWQDIAPWFGFSLTHSQSRSEGWVVDDFKKFSLDPDGYALDKQGEFVREREALKEELNKAKEMATEAEQRTEVVRLEKEFLQQQYTKERDEWETKNTYLIEEIGQLHEEKKRNVTKEG
ncbi:hypothetical protein R1flu_020762 [Riccia fluitans]|uniref:Uncharacterized protein n=1 Tax=Riccia fluitans TaxID=41844 RepID=A0ABD1ZMF9_9MARC